MNSIELKFPNTTVALAGNPFGKTIFSEQVEPKLSNYPVTIVFPDQISFITSSFIQGFFDYWLRKMTYDQIHDNIIIQSSKKKKKKYIWDNLN